MADLEKKAAQAEARVDEPVAWMATSPEGNCVVWTASRQEAIRIARDKGYDMRPLYSRPASADPKETALQPMSREGMRLSDPEMKPVMDELKRRMLDEPGFALSLLQRAGIANPDGSLSEDFGGIGLGDLPGMWDQSDLTGGSTDCGIGSGSGKGVA